MEIIKRSKVDLGPMTVNATCAEKNGKSVVFHKDHEKKITFTSKIDVNGEWYGIEREFLFCPFCGEGYGKED